MFPKQNSKQNARRQTTFRRCVSLTPQRKTTTCGQRCRDLNDKTKQNTARRKEDIEIETRNTTVEALFSCRGSLKTTVLNETKNTTKNKMNNKNSQKKLLNSVEVSPYIYIYIYTYISFFPRPCGHKCVCVGTYVKILARIVRLSSQAQC